MTDTITYQNIDLSSWITLYFILEDSWGKAPKWV